MISGAIKRIAVRGIIIFGISGLLVASLLARSVEPGITFATEGIDLKIDSYSTYNGLLVPGSTWSLKNLIPTADRFFKFNDIKPGDSGKTTISMHIKKKSAWLCLDFKNLTNTDNGVNEPEGQVDSDLAHGELAQGMEFFAWIDDGDNVFEKNEKPVFGSTGDQAASTLLNNTTYAVGDSQNNNACGINQVRYVGIYWCAGNLTVNLQTAKLTCDGSVLGNAAQSDVMTVDVGIRALPSNENPQFLCTGNSNEEEGCSPGYWKQSHHFDDWASPYTPSKKFSKVFKNAFPGKTLLQVLAQGGGGLNALGRQTVAALLNAASGDVDYPYTTAQVISMFNAVYPGGNYETLKNKFEKSNTVYCPLENDSESRGSDSRGGNNNRTNSNNSHSSRW